MLDSRNRMLLRIHEDSQRGHARYEYEMVIAVR